MRKFLLIATLLFITTSCHVPDNFGFYQPITIDLAAPDGTPEFKAGWRDGCKSGLGVGTFANAAVYRTKQGPSFSTVYLHDGQYQNGWGSAYWACSGHAAYFMDHENKYPLE